MGFSRVGLCPVVMLLLQVMDDTVSNSTRINGLARRQTKYRSMHKINRLRRQYQ